MVERGATSLASRPTAEQIARFSKLTTEERFRWLVDTLAVCHELATPETRRQWRKHKDAQGRDDTGAGEGST
jgi:hypothetical protein